MWHVRRVASAGASPIRHVLCHTEKEGTTLFSVMVSSVIGYVAQRALAGHAFLQ